jgi:hypothetical protein
MPRHESDAVYIQVISFSAQTVSLKGTQAEMLFLHAATSLSVAVQLRASL